MLPAGEERQQDPMPERLRLYLSVLNMSEDDLNKQPADRLPNSHHSGSAGDELGVYSLFAMLLDEAGRTLENSAGSCSLEDDIAILEKGPDAVSPEMWACVLYRAGQKRIVRGYRKAAVQKLDTIMAQMKAAKS
jgi:Rubisco LSMT substrate-binding